MGSSGLAEVPDANNSEDAYVFSSWNEVLDNYEDPWKNCEISAALAHPLPPHW